MTARTKPKNLSGRKKSREFGFPARGKGEKKEGQKTRAEGDIAETKSVEGIKNIHKPAVHHQVRGGEEKKIGLLIDKAVAGEKRPNKVNR